MSNIRKILIITSLISIVCLLFNSNLRAEENITIQIKINQYRLMFDRSTGESYLNISLTNIGQYGISYPLKVVVESISDLSIYASNSDGVTDQGKPYYLYFSPGDNSPLTFQQQATTSPKTFRFKNPMQKRFTYTLSVQGVYAKPTITSISSQFANIGAEIRLKGDNFREINYENKIAFGNILSNYVYLSKNEIATYVPPGIENCNVKVIMNGLESNSIPFFGSPPNSKFSEVILDSDLNFDKKANFIKDPETGGTFSVGRFIVIPRDGMIQSELTNLLTEINGFIAGTIKQFNMVFIDLYQPSNLENANSILSYIKSKSYIESAELNTALSSSLCPKIEQPFTTWKWDKYITDGAHDHDNFGGNWGQIISNFPGAWNFIKLGSNQQPIINKKVKIGIIDSGFFFNNREFQNQNITVMNPSENWPKDHGTAVAGIIGANFSDGFGINGVNPFSELYCYAIPDPCDFSEIFVAINALCNKGVKVINISKGIDYENSNPNNNPLLQIQAITEKIQFKLAFNRIANKPLLVVSAGNNGSPNKVDAKWGSGINLARSEGMQDIIVVGASETTPSFSEIFAWEGNNYYFGGFSLRSTAGHVERSIYSNVGKTVDVTAPGDIISVLGPYPQHTPIKESPFYGSISGTSFSAPMVTGLIGLMFAFHENLTNNQVTDFITSPRTRTYTDPLDNVEIPFLDAFASMARIPGFLDAIRDVNSDGIVDANDAKIVKEAWKNHEGIYYYPFSKADLNGDGTIDESDYKLFPDTDVDGIADLEDNCPLHYNPDQKDSNNNDVGDVCESPQTTTAFYDNFDDGRLDGWGFDGGSRYYTHPSPMVELPVLVTSPGGYAVAPGNVNQSIGGWMKHSLSISNGSTLSVSMVAKSPSGWPNHSAFWLWEAGKNNYYKFYDFGENHTAYFEHGSIDGQGHITAEVFAMTLPNGDYQNWHLFNWKRNSDGYWSFYADNVLRFSNFTKDNSITSFDMAYINVGGSGSQIESVQIDVTVAPVP